jgi:hypothetical protein
VTREGVDPELRTELDYARGIARRLDAGVDVAAADVRHAVRCVIDVFDAFRHRSDFPDPELAIDPAAAEQLALESQAGDIGETNDDL